MKLAHVTMAASAAPAFAFRKYLRASIGAVWRGAAVIDWSNRRDAHHFSACTKNKLIGKRTQKAIMIPCMRYRDQNSIFCNVGFAQAVPSTTATTATTTTTTTTTTTAITATTNNHHHCHHCHHHHRCQTYESQDVVGRYDSHKHDDERNNVKLHVVGEVPRPRHACRVKVSRVKVVDVEQIRPPVLTAVVCLVNHLIPKHTNSFML
jgi:hypothetical protein